MPNPRTVQHRTTTRPAGRAPDSTWSVAGPEGAVVFHLTDTAGTGQHDTAKVTATRWQPHVTHVPVPAGFAAHLMNDIAGATHETATELVQAALNVAYDQHLLSTTKPVPPAQFTTHA